MIAIVDYGMGNLRSVQKGFESLGVAAQIVNRPEQIAAAHKLVLPGVGAFRDAIGELRRQELIEPLCAHARADRPFLGICLGLQLLFETSLEEGTWPGLGVLAGDVVRFTDQPGMKVPHMGWNEVQIRRASPLWTEIPDRSHFYFVHSYHVRPTDREVVAAETDYGGLFTAVVERGALFATQFHPEKSQAVGLQLLRNFAQL
ncbi:MAG: imidazole glycerol phosphate synthase subunit HisH [Planctomycetaceae bacterium]